MIDDSSRADSVEKLRRMALNDTLTGLPNRLNFHQRLDLELEWAREHGGRLALIGIDLNRFKEINDLRGHKAGDEVLRILGRRLRGLLQDDGGEFIARTGGMSFRLCAALSPGSRSRVFCTGWKRSCSSPSVLRIRKSCPEPVWGSPYGRTTHRTRKP